MRSWFYRHPTIAFVLLGLYCLMCALFLLYFIERRVWWFAALNLYCMITAIPKLHRWWLRT